MNEMEKRPEDRPLRADAARNRARLLTAAHEVFSERGADASFEDIARHAKVGIGTLYRHFPSREALLAASCDERLLEIARASQSREGEEGDAAEALASYIEQLVTSAGLYRGLATSIGVVLRSGTPGCHATTQEGERLLARAKRERVIKRDVLFADVVCIVTAVALAAPGDPARIRRLIAMFFDGMRCA
jgi:AcrR family transcriptional regulator